MKKLSTTLAFLATLLPAGVVLAVPAPMPVTIVSVPSTISTIEQFVGAICTIGNVLFTMLMILGVVIFLYAAFLFLTSGGNENRTSQGRTTLYYAVIGILVGLLARGSVVALGTILGSGAPPQC